MIKSEIAKDRRLAEDISSDVLRKRGDASGMAVAQAHYNQCAIEPIEIMQMYFTPQEMYGFCKGNALKYILRSRFKEHELQDMEKALQYVEWAVNVLKGKNINPKKGR